MADKKNNLGIDPETFRNRMKGSGWVDDAPKAAPKSSPSPQSLRDGHTKTDMDDVEHYERQEDGHPEGKPTPSPKMSKPSDDADYDDAEARNSPMNKGMKPAPGKVGDVY